MVECLKKQFQFWMKIDIRSKLTFDRFKSRQKTTFFIFIKLHETIYTIRQTNCVKTK